MEPELIQIHSFLDKDESGNWLVSVRYYDKRPEYIPIHERMIITSFPIAEQSEFELDKYFVGKLVFGRLVAGQFSLQGVFTDLNSYS
jgi:hypothetical protein